ncbi:UNVERIFIED_CONTAM: protein MIZU-KUSSEI 1 [Sesamum radiatum]|uniref:Protein MIZU-KUSSEI 1 n=1 Tax=Sesamum radiatum TaxID=300843 RepID=A0AAW2V5U8_SESRA
MGNEIKSVDHEDKDEDEDEDIIIDISTFKFEEKELVNSEEPRNRPHSLLFTGSAKAPRRKFLVMAVSKLRSALALGRARIQFSSGLGRNVVGTVFTCRRGHVHFAFQDHFNATPAFLVELPMPRSILLKEMSSGLVRIALECDKNKGIGLLAEPVWRTYCNGRSMGMLPAGSEHGAESDGKLIYMRAKFENIVGSSDCEAFYMMNPDGNAARN